MPLPIDGYPPRFAADGWDDERRIQIRCELDAAFFRFPLGSDDEWARGRRALAEVRKGIALEYLGQFESYRAFRLELERGCAGQGPETHGMKPSFIHRSLVDTAPAQHPQPTSSPQTTT